MASLLGFLKGGVDGVGGKAATRRRMRFEVDVTGLITGTPALNAHVVVSLSRGAKQASTTPIKIVSAELVEMQKAKITVMSSMQHSERGPLSKIFKLQVKAVTLDEKRRVASSVVLAGGDVDVALFAPGHAEQAKATMKTFVVDRRIKSRSSSSHPVNIQAVVTCTWVGPRLVGSAAWPSEEQHVRAHERGSGEASPGDLSDMSYDSDVDGAEHSILTADHQIQSRLVMSDASHLPGTRAHPSSRASLRSHLVGGEDGDEPETGTTEVSLLASARGSSSSSLPSVPLQPITRVPLPGAHPPLPLTHKPPPTAAGGSSAPRASHADGAASGGGSGQKAVALQLKAAMPSAVLLPTGALASAHLPTFSPVKSRTVDGTTEAAGKKRAGGGGGASAGTGKSFADDQSLIEEARVEGAGVMPEEGVEREGCGGDAREEELAMLREEAAARERDLRTMRAALEASEVRLASVLARIRKGAPPTNQEGRVSKAGVGGAEEMHRGGWKLLEREVDDLEAQMRAKSLAVEEAAADALEHQKLSADALRHRDAAREERDAARGERGVVEADCAALRKERDDLRLRLRKLEGEVQEGREDARTARKEARLALDLQRQAREGEEAAMEEAGRLERKVEALKSAVKDQAADKERSEKSAADAARLLAGEAREAQAKAARLEAASREAAAGAARAEAKAREELEAARLQADAAVRGETEARAAVSEARDARARDGQAVAHREAQALREARAEGGAAVGEGEGADDDEAGGGESREMLHAVVRAAQEKEKAASEGFERARVSEAEARGGEEAARAAAAAAVSAGAAAAAEAARSAAGEAVARQAELDALHQADECSREASTALREVEASRRREDALALALADKDAEALATAQKLAAAEGRAAAAEQSARMAAEQLEEMREEAHQILILARAREDQDQEAHRARVLQEEETARQQSAAVEARRGEAEERRSAEAEASEEGARAGALQREDEPRKGEEDRRDLCARIEALKAEKREMEASSNPRAEADAEGAGGQGRDWHVAGLEGDDRQDPEEGNRQDSGAQRRFAAQEKWGDEGLEASERFLVAAKVEEDQDRIRRLQRQVRDQAEEVALLKASALHAPAPAPPSRRVRAPAPDEAGDMPHEAAGDGGVEREGAGGEGGRRVVAGIDEGLGVEELRGLLLSERADAATEGVVARAVQRQVRILSDSLQDLKEVHHETLSGIEKARQEKEELQAAVHALTLQKTAWQMDKFEKAHLEQFDQNEQMIDQLIEARLSHAQADGENTEMRRQVSHAKASIDKLKQRLTAMEVELHTARQQAEVPAGGGKGGGVPAGANGLMSTPEADRTGKRASEEGGGQGSGGGGKGVFGFRSAIGGAGKALFSAVRHSDPLAAPSPRVVDVEEVLERDARIKVLSEKLVQLEGMYSELLAQMAGAATGVAAGGDTVAGLLAHMGGCAPATAARAQGATGAAAGGAARGDTGLPQEMAGGAGASGDTAGPPQAHSGRGAPAGAAGGESQARADGHARTLPAGAAGGVTGPPQADAAEVS